MLRTVFAVYFIAHIPITLLIDAQALLPSHYFPKGVINVLEWYNRASRDPLMDSNASVPWFQALILCELVFQLPVFFLLAKFYLRRSVPKYNSMDVLALVYGTHVVTTMVPIFGVFVSEQRLDLIAIYSPYFFFPLAIACNSAISIVKFMQQQKLNGKSQ